MRISADNPLPVAPLPLQHSGKATLQWPRSLEFQIFLAPGYTLSSTQKGNDQANTRKLDRLRAFQKDYAKTCICDICLLNPIKTRQLCLCSKIFKIFTKIGCDSSLSVTI